jgi:hypothetical protein
MMRRSDLEWLLRDADNLPPERVERIKRALNGDADAWEDEKHEHALVQAEIAADYHAERYAHESPYDYREEEP